MTKNTDKETITVSLWLGRFQTKEHLEDYVAVDYSGEDHGPLSPFWTDYHINTGDNARVDPDLQESSWKSQAKNMYDFLEGHSYAEYVTEMVKAKHRDLHIRGYNAIIQVIGNYEGKLMQTANTLFLGSYTFDYEQPDYMKNLFD